jgi:diguanylate cyclase (GGDEF)-like protein
MYRPSPLLQLTAALVALTLGLLLASELLLGALPGRADAERRERARVAQALAVQVTELVRRGEGPLLQSTLQSLAARIEGVVSVAVRRNGPPEGSLVAESGAHAQHWSAGGEGDRLTVPLAAEGRPWGAVEVVFAADRRFVLQRWWDEPMVRLMAFFTLAGALAYGLYLRRALLHLDPASVIPERVQHAFDAMAEGVVVLDLKGRVLLANRAFRGLHPQAAEVGTGQVLSNLPWMGAGLSSQSAQHPWNRMLASGAQTSGDALTVGQDIGCERRLVVNCAPISDAGGALRGALVTFDDLTELHHANVRLQQAMADVTAANEEVQRKNEELLRLATRDPLTGCLNRRALYEALGPMHASARRDGTPLGCLVLDIDHFKRVNDTHGHGIGDRVIQEVARKLLDSARATDLVCRYGGEEFVVVAPGLAPAEMQSFAERVRARIEADCGRAVREVPGLVVTASLGCDPHGERTAGPQAMIEGADQALYRAKRGGRNRVALACAPEDQALLPAEAGAGPGG